MHGAVRILKISTQIFVVAAFSIFLATYVYKQLIGWLQSALSSPPSTAPISPALFSPILATPPSAPAATPPNMLTLHPEIEALSTPTILQLPTEPDVQEEVPISNTSSPVVEAYCVKCRHKRPMLQPKEVTTKNGRRALEDICQVCQTRLFRFI